MMQHNDTEINRKQKGYNNEETQLKKCSNKVSNSCNMPPRALCLQLTKATKLSSSP